MNDRPPALVCGFRWLSGRGHRHICDRVKFHPGAHRCACGVRASR